uniref:DDE Tnp4 domain-containing protein n=1 Tax=Meloidogyne enterolobii TaxID=390850 RepID=A0A6V7WL85_MELEN|nr:unnamed protein product [Meloidogyne enterolobii]
MSPQVKLLAALRFYATGSIYGVIGDAHGPSKDSIGRAIKQVTKAINLYMFQQLVKYPSNFDNTTTGFFEKGGIPSIFGCIDGTLIKILAPSKYEEQFVDRKNEHSLNVMLVCGPNLKFYDASVRWPGATHDARVFKNSKLCERLQNGWRPFTGAILLGDSGNKLDILIYILYDFMLHVT